MSNWQVRDAFLDDNGSFAVPVNGVFQYAPNIVGIYRSLDMDAVVAEWPKNEERFIQLEEYVSPMWILVPAQFIASQFPDAWRDFHSGSSDIPPQSGSVTP